MIVPMRTQSSVIEYWLVFIKAQMKEEKRRGLYMHSDKDIAGCIWMKQIQKDTIPLRHNDAAQ
jgi:hypothetical protein